MLKISIIIPVFKVQGFLRECLDSILASPYPHLEVIGVDDCSPDQSGEILAEYARTDPRVRMLRTPHNSGSGVARNLGFDAADGDYVWFADSDDLIAPGAIERIVAALDRFTPQERPDVLLFDYRRLTEDGQLADSDLPGLLAAGGPPAEFTFATWPTVARYTHTCWNKVVRRDYLAELGLRFHAGWYQDVPWSYPVLMNARRLSLLDAPCYLYRQRRAGSVTRTTSDRHFDVFTQWERAWSHLGDDHDETVRAILYNRMIWHCMQVLGNDGRVTSGTRRRFFRHAADVFRRHHPGASYRRPSGGEGSKHLLLRYRWYGGYLLTRLARRTYNRLRWGHPHGGYSSRGLRHALATTALRWRRRLTDVAALRSLWHRRRPIRPDLVVFATEGYGRPEGVCAALDEAVATLLPGRRRVWLTTTGRPGDETAAPGSSAAARAIGRAKYVITDFDADLGPKRQGAVHVRALAHTPVEVVGLDRRRLDGSPDVEGWFTVADRWDYVVSPNRHAAEVVDRAFQVRAAEVQYGLPRSRWSQEATDEVRRSLGVPSGHRLVFYHPAARPGGLATPTFDLVALERATPTTTVLALDETGRLSRSDADGNVTAAPLPAEVSPHDLYRAADIAVGDYRGALVDRATAGAATVLYVPDWERMRAAGAVTADLVAEPPGPVCRDWNALTAYLSDPVPVPPDTGFLHRFGDWTSRDAAESVIRHVFGLAPARPADPEPPAVTGPATPVVIPDVLVEQDPPAELTRALPGASHAAAVVIGAEAGDARGGAGSGQDDQQRPPDDDRDQRGHQYPGGNGVLAAPVAFDLVADLLTPPFEPGGFALGCRGTGVAVVGGAFGRGGGRVGVGGVVAGPAGVVLGGVVAHQVTVSHRPATPGVTSPDTGVAGPSPDRPPACVTSRRSACRRARRATGTDPCTARCVAPGR
ncbi:bifunctional glycosyltransferase/CDP-glycerol:glycerophosphate glycerophosphotransferase [Stackebrandtia albiflava]|nr:glycosyltransferase [Stackebrandtia albiflava]